MKHFPQPLTREALGARCDCHQTLTVDGGELTVFYRVAGEWELPDSGPSFWVHDLSVMGCALDEDGGDSVMLTEDEAVARFGRETMDLAMDMAVEGLE